MMRLVSARFLPLIVAIFVCVSPSFAHAQSEANYSRGTDLGVIQMSYGDLYAVIDKIRTLAQTANGLVSNGGQDAPYERLSIYGAARRGWELTGAFSAADVEAAPFVAYRFDYSFVQRGAFPVTEISLSFDDPRRSVKVVGKSIKHVDAIFASITADLSDYETVLGGDFHRLIVGMLFWMFVNVSCVIAIDSAKRSWTKMVLALPMVLVPISYFALPWSRWLAGVAVYRGDASFMIRFAPEISFAGLVLAIIPIAASLIGVLKNRKPDA